MAIYQCPKCERQEFAPHRFRYHLGPACRCPLCGSQRMVRLKERDRIDPFHHGFLNLLERMAGGTLYHCRWCRVQFYDRRKLASELPVPKPPEVQGEVSRAADAKRDRQST